MSNKIEEFLSEKFGEVRAVKDANDVIWFVASDIAKILGYRMASDMTRLIDDEDKDTQTMRTPSGEQNMSVVNEGGLYSVVLSITKRNPERYELSRDFKRWITNEVLPTLRQSGAYVENGREQEVVDKYFTGLSDETKLLVFKELVANNEKNQVKAEKFDKFLDVEGTHTFTEVAKMLSTKANEEYDNGFKLSNRALTSYLREKGILSKVKNKSGYANLPNKEYEDYFDVVSRNVNEEFLKSQTRVKPQGIEFIYDELVLDGFQLK